MAIFGKLAQSTRDAAYARKAYYEGTVAREKAIKQERENQLEAPQAHDPGTYVNPLYCASLCALQVRFAHSYSQLCILEHSSSARSVDFNSIYAQYLVLLCCCWLL